jgi:hypothetical protein
VAFLLVLLVPADYRGARPHDGGQAKSDGEVVHDGATRCQTGKDAREHGQVGSVHR